VPSRQPVLLGFWRQILEEPAAQLDDAVEQATEAVRASGVPYVFLAGGGIDPTYRRWLATRLTSATLEDWRGTGHFPHLADPQRFAGLLAMTASWEGPRVAR
jgi:pimeloyl-ACP methyl ester carboxylesterase